MEKKFLTYQQQIDKLKYEKELTINDEAYALHILEHISYYSLIGGYKQPFKHKPSGKYIYGVTFEEIVSFYHFDEELRTLFLKYILHVERHLGSLLSYYFCEKYGEKEETYLTTDHFNVSEKNLASIEQLIKTFKKIIFNSHYNYVKHYRNKYHNVPLWVTVHALTFGNLSTFYQYMEDDLKAKISKHFSTCSEKELHQFITVVAKFRNACAHGERLYNFQTKESIPNTVLHKKLCIPKKNNQYQLGKNDLFACFIALRYLLGDDEFESLKEHLLHLIAYTLQQCPHIAKNQLLKEMGFPDNWTTICNYKLY